MYPVLWPSTKGHNLDIALCASQISRFQMVAKTIAKNTPKLVRPSLTNLREKLLETRWFYLPGVATMRFAGDGTGLCP